jgi:hypothetical protein
MAWLSMMPVLVGMVRMNSVPGSDQFGVDDSPGLPKFWLAPKG